MISRRYPSTVDNFISLIVQLHLQKFCLVLLPWSICCIFVQLHLQNHGSWHLDLAPWFLDLASPTLHLEHWALNIGSCILDIESWIFISLSRSSSRDFGRFRSPGASVGNPCKVFKFLSYLGSSPAKIPLFWAHPAVKRLRAHGVLTSVWSPVDIHRRWIILFPWSFSCICRSFVLPCCLDHVVAPSFNCVCRIMDLGPWFLDLASPTLHLEHWILDPGYWILDLHFLVEISLEGLWPF